MYLVYGAILLPYGPALETIFIAITRLG